MKGGKMTLLARLKCKDDFRILFYTGDLDLVCSALHVGSSTAEIAKTTDLEVFIIIFSLIF